METILKTLWGELHPDTITRLTYFRNAFREHFSTDEISEQDLDKCVAYTFGTYGQGMVYNIYTKAQQKLEDKETLKQAFTEFTNAFNEVGINHLPPHHYISLFIEYTYSLVIKNK